MERQLKLRSSVKSYRFWKPIRFGSQGWLGLLFGCLIALLGCTPPMLPPPRVTISPSPTVTKASTLPTETDKGSAHQPTITPTSTVSQTQLDLTPYKQAMLPQFATDVDLEAANGVSRYDILVTVDKASLQTDTGVRLHGLVQVIYTNNENIALDKIYFRLYPNLPGYGGEMAVQQVLVAEQTVTPTLEADNSALAVPLPMPLQPHQSLNITLTYTAVVPIETVEGYNIFSYSGGTLALAGFYPVIAVYDKEGWNIPVPPVYGDATYLDVSLYEVTANVPANMVVVGSGNLLHKAALSDDYKALTFATGPMRDFYLVMRPDFEVISNTVDGVVINSYYPPDLAKGGKFVLKYASDALHFYNEHFGPYPYAEFDVVATPTTAGGVEYPGVVVAAEQFYTETGGYLQHVVGHEVAHQWWYGLVGNNQVTAPWLDEAFTNYSTLLYWQAVEGQAVADQVTEDFFRAPYQKAKKNGHDHPVAGAVADFAPEDYGAIVYGKGPLFFLALQQQVGDDVFYKITQTYYTEYKYKIAQPDDLIDVIERVHGKNITPLYQEWIIGQ